MSRRFYVRVSNFSLGRVLMALLNDNNVEEVGVSLEDDELLVSFSENPNRCLAKAAEPCCDKICDKDNE